jgi:FkbM family methyltransferase
MIKYLSKLNTLIHLAVQGEWRLILRQWHQYTIPARLLKNGLEPFIHNDSGFPAVCHPDWPDSVAHFRGAEGDHWEVELIRRWLSRGDAVIDIGCNTGFYSFAASEKVGQTGQVLAVDADAFIVDKLTVAAILLKSEQLQPLHAAVAAHSGSVTFYVTIDRKVTTEQSLSPGVSQMDGSVPVTTPAQTMKDIIAKLRNPRKLSFIKIDIEGAEALALKEIPVDCITSDGPMWLVEINPGALARFDATPSAVVSRFSDKEFECWLLPKHPLIQLPANKMLRKLEKLETFSDSLYYNLLAVPLGDRWKQQRTVINRFLRS